MSGYLSCEWIEGGLMFAPYGTLKMCCIPNKGTSGQPMVMENFTGGLPPIMDIYEKKRMILPKNGVPYKNCEGCSQLKCKQWPDRSNYFLDLIHISHFTRCNLKCTYCYLTKLDRHITKENTYKILPTLKVMIKSGLIARDARAIWGGGEPTLLEEFNEIQQLLFDNVKFIGLATNATIFSNITYEMLKASKFFSVTTSLDAGTSDTFRKIRGINAFDSVVRNVIKYGETGGKITLKYIITDGNCTRTDAAEFASICSQANPSLIMVDLDCWFSKPNDEHIRMSMWLQDELLKRNLPYYLAGCGVTSQPKSSFTDHKSDQTKILA